MGITVVLIRTAGAPAVKRALPLYLGILMVAGVIFAPNGMDTATAVAGMQVSPGTRGFLWLGWLLLATPAARAIFAAPSLDYLRWLPLSQTGLWLRLGAMLLVLQAPWVLLFAIGGGPLPALAALWLSAGMHAVVVIRPRPGERWRKWAALAAGFGLWVAPLSAGPDALASLHCVVGVAMWALALPRAWRRAPERNREQRSRRLLAGVVSALAQCHLTSVYRNRAAALWRGFMVMLLGAGATYLLARANHLYAGEVAVYSAVVAVLCTTIACSGLSVAIAESEAGLSWLLTSTGTSPRTRVLARLVASTCLGAALGLCYGGLVVYAVSMTPLSGARVVGGALAIAVAQMWAAQRVVAWSESDRSRGRRPGRAREIDGSRVVGALALIAVAQLVALGTVGDVAILGFMTLAFALSWGRT